MDADEEQSLIVSGRFENIEFIGNSMIVLGVPFDAPSEFKRKVWAAAQCYLVGNSSMDYYYKRYGSDATFPRPTENQRTLAALLRGCGCEVQRIQGQLSNGVERQSTLGLFASESALLRLSISFRYAAFLLMQGATYEAAAILRLCLEQIAWAFEIHILDDDSVFQKNPTKSVSRLKEIDASCGKIYSLLSDYTHIHPKLQRGYLDFSEKYAAVLYHDHDAALSMGDLYARVVTMYVRTAERISYKYFEELKAWDIAPDGELVSIDRYSCRTAYAD